MPLTCLSATVPSTGLSDGAIPAVRDALDQWHVTIHTDIVALESVWASLESTGGCTPFQSFDWLTVWYETTTRYGIAEPVIISATRSINGPTEVILPLCRIRRFGLSVLTFPDLAISDFAGPVFNRDMVACNASFVALWQAILRNAPRDDAIHLTKLCDSIGGVPSPLMSGPTLCAMDEKLWGLALEPGSGRASAMIPPELRASIEKRRSTVARKFRRRFSWSDTAGEVSAGFNELAEMRRLRSTRIAREDILENPMWRDFYEHLIASTHLRLKPLILRLIADDQTIATLFGVAYNGVFHYLIPTFLMEKWSRYTPGFQLLVDSMEACSARGYRYFDLTVGDEAYKAHFGAETRPLYECFVPLSYRGLLGYGLWKAWRLARKVRRIIVRDYIAGIRSKITILHLNRRR
jgi:CelD/BcsL family acetyltransferase involved in cellulose biosynthesis